MKKTTYDFPVEKFPRIQSVSESVVQLKELVDCLNVRKKLVAKQIKDAKVDNLTDYDVNEKKIILIKTDIELAKVHTSIINKEKDIKDYIEKVITPTLNVIDKDYDRLYNNAKILAKKDKVMAQAIADTKFELFEDNWEHKFNFFIAIKNYMQTPASHLKRT